MNFNVNLLSFGSRIDKNNSVSGISTNNVSFRANTDDKRDEFVRSKNATVDIYDDSKNLIKTVEYDEQHRVFKQTFYDAGNISYIQEYVYSPSGLVQKEIVTTYRPDGKISSYTAEEDFDAGDFPHTTTKINYHKNGSYSEHIHKMSMAGHPLLEVNNFYDKNGNYKCGMKITERYNLYGNLLGRIEEHYDSQRNVVKKIVTDANGNSIRKI